MGMAYTAKQEEVRRVFSIAGTDHGQFARDYLQNPTFAENIDTWFDGLKFPNGPVHFEGKEAVKELTRNSDIYDLKLITEHLANRDILIIAGWDDQSVSMESHILPFYRALVGANAQQVQIYAFQDNHLFENTHKQLAHTVINWILKA